MQEKIDASVAALSDEKVAEGLRALQDDIFTLWQGRRNGDLTTIVAVALLEEAAKRLTK